MKKGYNPCESIHTHTHTHTVLLEKKQKNNKKVENYTLVNKSGVILSSQKSENKISVKTVTVYPPGVPALVPGMRINKECIAYLKNCGGEITGMKDGKLKVMKEG